jgi:2-succinyl-6-hydroxy-2,4-cyclohexadiene-1-carboxylate synthase
MGGRLALYLALTFPDHFPRAVLESASPGLQTESERQTRIQHDEALALQIATNFPGFLQQWYEQPLFDSFRQHPQFAQKLKARSQQSPIALAQSLRHLSTGRQPNLWEKLQVHNQPLLLLVGERDRKFVTINRMMQQQCPTATLAVLPNLGHNLHFEDPLTYQQVVQDFLENSMHR